MAGSVEGLKPQNLTIVDVNGNTLTPDDGARPRRGLTSKQLDAQRGYETDDRAQPAGHARQRPGPGQSHRPGQRR